MYRVHNTKVLIELAADNKICTVVRTGGNLVQQ